MCTMTAKYQGTCTTCGERIRAGSQIDYSKATGARHVACAQGGGTGAPAHQTDAPGTIRLSGGSGYGCEGWVVGQVVLSGEKRRREGGPDGLVVLTASKRYCREEGLSFGVGDDQGYVYSATARAATREELQPRIDAAHEQALEVERARAIGALSDLFAARGEQPIGGTQISLSGETVQIDERGRVYGGGVWAVIEAAGPREAPAAETLAAATADLAARTTALRLASEALVAWTEAHMLDSAPHRKSNGGRAPHDGRVYGEVAESFSPADIPAYEAQVAEIQRLSYTSSPDSYHAAAALVRELEDAARLATYPRSIWLVRNNGADGDSWSANNVRTGGAGAIGRRLDWTADLEIAVRRCAARVVTGAV